MTPWSIRRQAAKAKAQKNQLIEDVAVVALFVVFAAVVWMALAVF